jgi:hypothetical protein
MKLFSLLGLAAFLSACAASTPDRILASMPSVDSATARVAQAPEALTQQNCVAVLTAAENDFASIEPASIDWRSADKALLKEQSSHWIHTLFEARIRLRDRIPELVRGDNHDPCLRAIRRFLVSARQAEELITESIQHFGLAYDQNTIDDQAFSNYFPYTVVNEKLGAFEVKAGDVLLDRGDSAESAQIALVGDVENLYSHTAVIGADAKGRLYVVETNAQDIVGVTPIKKYWTDNPDVRMALYRYKDAAMAHKAARFIFDYVHARRNKIPYDFHMNELDPSEMFCAEVVQYAYRQASNGTFVPPMYKSDLSKFDVMGRLNWLKLMGVPYSDVYAPVDVDVDPRFDLVADWRYSPGLREHRRDDAVMSSMYGWMVNDGYVFPRRLSVFVLTDMAEIKSRLIGDKEISKDMTAPVIRTALEFQRVFDLVAKNLETKENAFYKHTGHPLSMAGLKQVNEDFRIADCKAWQNNRGQFLKDSYQRSVRFVHESLRSETACSAWAGFRPSTDTP